MSISLPFDVQYQLAKVGLEDLAPGSMLKPFDGFFLDLPYPFAGKIELLANFFQCMGMLSVEAEIQADNIGFAIGEGG